MPCQIALTKMNIYIQLSVAANRYDAIIQIDCYSVKIGERKLWKRGDSTFCCCPLAAERAETSELVNGGVAVHRDR